MGFERTNTSSANQLEDSDTIYHCSKTLDEAFLVAYAVLGLVMFAGNTFCCAVFVITPQLRNCYMNIFLVSLGVADILAALFVIPGHCAFCTSCSKGYVLNILDKETCQFLDGVKDYVWVASVLSLLGITYDRYLAVIQPLRYHCKMTARTVTNILLTIWLLPVPVSFIKPILNAASVDFLKDNSHSESIFDIVVVIALVITPMAAIFVVNIMITKAIKKQLRKVDCERRRSLQDFKPKENRGKTKSCLIVVLVFLVCWFPRALLNFMFLFQIHHVKALKLLEKISLVFLFFQSSINPFLYSFYRKDFRQAAKNVLQRILPFKHSSSWFNQVGQHGNTSYIHRSKTEPALNCELTEFNSVN